MSMTTTETIDGDAQSNLDDNATICANQLIEKLLEGLSGRILWGILQILLMILGNIGNILTLIVLNRRLMRKGSINILLQGLAISDIVAPTLACIPHIIYYYGPRTDNKLIIFINSYVMPVATGATFCSNWIVVAITSFRLIIVVKPLYSQVYCSSRNEKKALCIILLVSILSIIPYYHYRQQQQAQYILKVISAILSLLGPWVICVILWILLIRIVSREIGSKRCRQFILHSEIIAQRLKSKSRITKMVLIICFFNIISQLPVLILTLFGIFNNDPCGYIPAAIFVCLLFISNLLLIINHSIHFFIYSLTNCKFRYSLKVMCRHCYSAYNNMMNKRGGMPLNYDEQQQQQPPNYQSNTYSNSRTQESPHLVTMIRLQNIQRQIPSRSNHLML